VKVRMRVNGCPGTLEVKDCPLCPDLPRVIIRWYCDCGVNVFDSSCQPDTGWYHLYALDGIFGPGFGGLESFPNCDCKENEIAWPQEKYDPRDLAILGGDPSL